MFNLIIDTTNQNCFFGVIQNHKLIAYSQTLTKKNLVNYCVQILDQLVHSCHCGYQNLQNIYLNIGPGSFTGVKVGVNLAKTICSVYPHTKIYTSSTLDILRTFGGSSCLDAKGQKKYVFNGIEKKMLPNNAVAQFTLGEKIHELEQIPPQVYFTLYFLHELPNFQVVKNWLELEPLYIRPAL